MAVVRQVAWQIKDEHGAACVNTNPGLQQKSKHLHFHGFFRGDPDEDIRAKYGHHDGWAATSAT
ncbi:hypothetical protein OG292_01040 [Streptomyces sp. NBC_01511]|uniref:hypothetical protein n=1 Tax=unclassified Streptomyces TaxID=2593676 RepID=UPI003868BB8D